MGMDRGDAVARVGSILLGWGQPDRGAIFGGVRLNEHCIQDARWGRYGQVRLRGTVGRETRRLEFDSRARSLPLFPLLPGS